MLRKDRILKKQAKRAARGFYHQFPAYRKWKKRGQMKFYGSITGRTSYSRPDEQFIPAPIGSTAASLQNMLRTLW